MSSAAPAASAISTYSVSETGTTGDSIPHARPMSTRIPTPLRSSAGIADPGVCAKAGSPSSRDFGRPAQSCSPCTRRRVAASSGGVRSECAMPRPAVIQLMAPGSIGWTEPMLSRCSMLPSKR
jgi:hypothetical protein